jgi:branched-chain amino acid transport system permease protein
VTLGQGAFFGIGAYAAGLMAKAGMGVAPLSDPLLGLAVAGLAAGAVGFATSFLVLRGSDLTRLMVTLGVALIFEEMVIKFKDITGGSDGLQGVMSSPVLGVWSFDLFGRTAFWYSLILTFLIFLFCRRLVNSNYGLSLLAIKGNPLRARTIGMPVNARLVSIYTIAAAIAGISGGMLTQTTQFVSPDMAAFHRSADALCEAGYAADGRARGLRTADFAQHDLFVCMDRSHVRDVVARGAPRERVILVRHFDEARDHDDVPDPYYGGRDGFTEMIAMLEAAMDGLVARVRADLERNRGTA